MRDETQKSSDALAAWLSKVAPVGCAVAVSSTDAPGISDFAEEEIHAASFAPGRRFEFRAGRLAARAALAQLGAPRCALPSRTAGDPVWPAGFVGSISHDRNVVVAVAAPSTTLSGVGLDLEPQVPLEAELIGLICRVDEPGDDASLSALGVDPAKLRFVAKEACFKAIFPAQRVMFDFLDLVIAFDAASGTFGARPANPRNAASLRSLLELRGYFGRAGGYICALACLR